MNMLHCGNCKKDVGYSVELDYSGSTDRPGASVEVGVDVNCDECGCTLLSGSASVCLG